MQLVSITLTKELYPTRREFRKVIKKTFKQFRRRLPAFIIEHEDHFVCLLPVRITNFELKCLQEVGYEIEFLNDPDNENAERVKSYLYINLVIITRPLIIQLLNLWIRSREKRLRGSLGKVYRL